MGFRRHKQVHRSICRAPRLNSYSSIWGSLRRRALTSSHFARRQGKSRSIAHLFHVPLAPAAYTLSQLTLPSLEQFGR
jgi:hypothetical protein